MTHIGADRMSITVHAPTAVVEKTLRVKINDYLKPGSTFGKLKVSPYQFYANTTAPTVPARFGVQTISGLSDVDRFFTSAQLAAGDCGDEDNAVISPLCVDVRSGGYFPADLRGLYNITGHGIDGTGQTIGFTLWTAAERQAAMNAFATNTGDQLITIDPNCVATGNSPTVPSSCTTQTVAPDHLLFILENGNLDNNFGSNVETALDIEAAHGVATHVGMKYYASDCASTTPPGSGLTNAGCNGSDVGLEEAIEDAANDPTLHTVSNSWAFGGEAEWGAADPFLVTAENSLTIAAAAGTTFYFSTGDSGTYESGYPSDSPHVVAVGGTSTYSTSTPATCSTTTTWSGGGSWCSNVIARPSWQTGSGVTANAPCAGRVIPDVSAISDPATGVRFTSTSNATGGTQSGQVGGTSLAAPVMNGLQAVTQNFVAAQTYPGATPSIGFVAPVLYQLGNSGNYASYFRDIDCGNTANPTSGPDGDAAIKGWDAATGWGEPDWFNFSIGYAMTLGATNLSVPPSLARSFAWSCAKTPSNSTERCVLLPVDVDVLRGRQRVGRNAVVRQVHHGRRLGRREHLLQEHRRRPDLVPVEQRHVLDHLHEQQHVCRGGGRRPRTDDDRQRLDVVGCSDRTRQQQAAYPGHLPEQLDLLRGRRPRQRDEVDRRRLDVVVAVHDRRQPDLRAVLPEHDGLLRDRHLRARPQDL